ncbi:MAG: hypothetical protein ACYCOU_04370 [Sulfobacillus sp.]
MNYTFIGQDLNCTGMTSKHLESRDPKHFFEPNNATAPEFSAGNFHGTGLPTEPGFAQPKTIESTELSRKYFSRENVEHVQIEIISSVNRASNGKFRIGRQSDAELAVVMRSVFLQFARHLPNDVDGQVAELNGRVLSYCVPKVLGNVEQYLNYRNNVRTSGRCPIGLPMATTSTGTRTNRPYI